MANNIIETVCVVGSGHMGWIFGCQCAVHGYPVWLYDIDEKSLQQAEKNVFQELCARVEKQQLTDQENKAIVERIQFVHELEGDATQADLAFEAVPERLELKREVFAQLDRIFPSNTILATGSSALPVSQIEDVTQRPDRVLNTHYYPPIWKMPMGEMMRGTATSEETLATVRQFMQSIGVTPLAVLKESTGYLFNRIWRAIKKECLTVVDTGVARLEDVDRAWNIFIRVFDASTVPGPFALMDIIGLDSILNIENVYYQKSGNNADAPPQLLTDKVEGKELGVKTGKGFYDYPNPAFQNPRWLSGKE